MIGVKLTKERIWVLGWWAFGGWTIGRPMLRGIKKWERHIEMLVKAGLLECEDLGGVGAKICRITPSGLQALGDSNATKMDES